MVYLIVDLEIYLQLTFVTVAGPIIAGPDVRATTGPAFTGPATETGPAAAASSSKYVSLRQV